MNSTCLYTENILWMNNWRRKNIESNTVKPVLRGHLWDKENVVFYDRWPLKRDSIHMKCSMIGQEKGDLLIRVTAW
jgi:hypothetical protein